jgi:hypothetical protein
MDGKGKLFLVNSRLTQGVRPGGTFFCFKVHGCP